MTLRMALLPLAVGSLVVAVVVAAARIEPVAVSTPAATPEGRAVATQANDLLRVGWRAEGLPDAAPADDLTVLRRLTLALHGTVPSLEEIRAFEADDSPERLRRWTRRTVRDDRFGRYLAERLARPMVGTAREPFGVYRRDRLTDWLAGQLNENVPWSDTVTRLIADEGVWTDTPSVNFLTSQISQDDLDENALAARTVRAFLGQRIDCAQCHDHPFDKWKQDQFEGLAACFGQSGLSIGGMMDDPKKTYEVQDRETLEMTAIDPAFPFGDDWLSAEQRQARPRAQLAAWVTHEENHRFDRAIVNRVWTLMLGRPLVPNRPVDDLPDPIDPVDRLFDDENPHAVLDLLADDFRASGRRLHRLVETIAATDAFLASTRQPDGVDSDDFDRELAEELWAVRPLVRLRPEQMIGSMLQAGSVRTIDRDSHLFVRFLRFVRENDFVNQYGDAGEAELADRSATIPQALLRMNGKLARELSEATPISAAGRIAAVQKDDAKLVETAYLVCLTRRPGEEEAAFFVDSLATADNRERAVEDLFWTLFNSPEFSWIR